MGRAIRTKNPLPGRLPSLRERVVVYARQGQLVVAKWPKKRGPAKTPGQRFWHSWFKQANFLAKYASDYDQVAARRYSEGTPLYPRDLILCAMRGRLYWWQDETGWKWFPVAAATEISEALDVLGQTVGDILVRATDRWRPPPAGNAGDVLTHQGAGNPPTWAASSGGVSQGYLSGTPITPDNTVNNYVLDVSNLFTLDLVLDGIGFAGSSWPSVEFSVDGGISYKQGTSDYRRIRQTDASKSINNGAFIPLNGNSVSTGGFCGTFRFSCLRGGRPNVGGQGGNTGSGTVENIWGYTNFAGPVTHIKLFSNNGHNFNAGVIYPAGLG